MHPSKASPVEILLVEDNPGDVRLTLEALKEGRLINSVHVVEDGEAAIEFLYQRGTYENVPRPSLILLDLNLPKRDGRELHKHAVRHRDASPCQG